MKWTNKLSAACLFTYFVACGVATSAQAQESPSQESPVRAAWKEAATAMQRGAVEITLRDQAKLKLPEGYAFVPLKEATKLMTAMGNQTSEQFIGLVVPLSDASWFVIVDYEASGYIKDDDAK